MPTRIKRYEERLDKLDKLLGRIEEEMGSQAKLETREFRRGGILGLIGGLRMIEVVATTEVELNLKPPSKVGPASVQKPPANSALLANRETAPAPIETVTEAPPAVGLAGKVGEGLAAITKAVDNGQRTVDLQADESLDLPFATSGKAPTLPQQVVTELSQVPTPLPVDESEPPVEAQMLNPELKVSSHEVAEDAIAQREEIREATSSGELAEIKSTISELTQTINQLVAQGQTGQAQAIAGEAPTAGSVKAGAGSPTVNPVSIDPGTMFSGVQRNVFDRLLDWNIGPYDAIGLINTALGAHDDSTLTTEDSLIQMVTRDICRNVLLSGGIELRPGPPGKVVALVGATGIGKTTTIAKLAAHFAFHGGKRVSLVSLDNYRIAAAEQLRTYTEIMGIDLDIVFSKEEFDQVLTQRAHNDLILIDTAGRSPLNTKQIFELRDIFSTHPPDEVHLVVSASTKGDDLRTILENFEPLSYDHVIVSKLDETRSLGCVYNINKMCQMPISYFTVGQSVPEDIRTATLSFIQAWIDQGRIV